MKPRSNWTRRSINFMVMAVSTLSSFIGIAVLVWVLYEIIYRGIGAFNWDFFTKLPTPPGVEGGGLANAILGTVVITALATLIGVPIGLFAGVFLAEFGLRSKLSGPVRFVSNILMGTPSIIIGVFVYAMLVVTVRHFSGYAGAVALAIIMIPLVARTTEDMLNLVPDTLRESALALGVPRWKTTLDIVFKAAKKGLLTGSLLAVARVSGETAPLLFTALNSPYWPGWLNKPTGNLTVTIYNYAMSPYTDWQQMAWGASLLITLGVLFLTLCARFLLQEKK
ncbi:MAG: phosphate ABC transporter permease PstA [Phycisphaerae bacterium]|nr:phosphate ABC transporter permease PstA [Phycisphaerae bacterium]